MFSQEPFQQTNSTDEKTFFVTFQIFSMKVLSSVDFHSYICLIFRYISQSGSVALWSKNDWK